jgi:protein-disulfide isomerase
MGFRPEMTGGVACIRLAGRRSLWRRPSLALSVLFVVAAVLFGASPAVMGEDLLAEVGENVISAEAVERALGVQLTQLYEQIFELKKRKLEELISEELLTQEAAKRGISVQQLFASEVENQVAPVGEEEVERAYQQGRARLRGPEQAVRERIRSGLYAQRAAAQKEVFLRQLRAEYRVVVHLVPPTPVRVVIPDREGAAIKGPPAAPVAIVEFADFQCPYCRRVLAELAKVLAAYPKEVHFTYRHFPIDRLHSQARPAAEAAECAGAQGRFWDYHDRLFEQAESLSEVKLRELATQLGLDLPAFERCLNGEWARGRVALDVEAGTRASVSGTPTFFINGRSLVGAQSFEALKIMIDQELTVRRR